MQTAKVILRNYQFFDRYVYREPGPGPFVWHRPCSRPERIDQPTFVPPWQARDPIAEKQHNWWPLGHESPPIITRPGLPPDIVTCLGQRTLTIGGEVSLYSWPPVWLVWIWPNTPINLAAVSKPTTQEISRTVILPPYIVSKFYQPKTYLFQCVKINFWCE